MRQWFWTLSDRVRQWRMRRLITAGEATGRQGEDAAHRFLRDRGFRVVARNWRRRSGAGEVDLIAWDGDELVFVEVKTRRSDAYGPPERAIGTDKEDALIWSAREYARRAWIDWSKVRFDVVTVLIEPKATLTHYERAFKP